MSILSWTIHLAQQSPGPDIRDIKGPLTYGSDHSLFLIAGIFIALLIGFLLFYFLRVKKKKKLIPLRSPHEIACEALEQLKLKQLPEKGRMGDYYVELSGVIRRYLEDRFRFKAPEMTTEDLLQRIEESNEFPRDQKTLLSHFLVQCDLVKFAKYRPLPEEIESSFKTGREIIDQTKEGFRI